ncbi:MAG TPA: class I SAM-dependent methyltransferase [Gemmatimonadota bacterium]
MSGASFYLRHVRSPEYRASRARKAELVYAMCAEHLATAGHVVDLGAGTGIMTRALETLSGRSIVGFELDRSFMQETERMAVADLEALPVADGAIDFGIANHVYEHVASLDRFFAELARALAAGGRVYLTAGNRYAPIEPHYRIPTLSWWPRPVADRLLRWSGRGESYDDIRFTTHAKLRRAAARHGLELEDVTDEALATQLDRYDSLPGRLAGRAARLLPGAVRRRLLDLGSPQWFFFVGHRDAR